MALDNYYVYKLTPAVIYYSFMTAELGCDKDSVWRALTQVLERVLYNIIRKLVSELFYHMTKDR